jgi:hypothetical protein
MSHSHSPPHSFLPLLYVTIFLYLHLFSFLLRNIIYLPPFSPLCHPSHIRYKVLFTQRRKINTKIRTWLRKQKTVSKQWSQESNLKVIEGSFKFVLKFRYGIEIRQTVCLLFCTLKLLKQMTSDWRKNNRLLRRVERERENLVKFIIECCLSK